MPRLLLIDDEDNVVEILQRMLLQKGFQVETAYDGFQGLEMLKNAAAAEQPFDLVLTDLKMPRLDGITLAGIIDEKYELPVVIITGYPSDESMLAAMRSGVLDYITKPFSDEMLIAAIRCALQKHSLQRSSRQLQQMANRLKLQLDSCDASEGAQNIPLLQKILHRWRQIVGQEMASDDIYRNLPAFDLLDEYAAMLGISGMLIMAREGVGFKPVISKGLSDSYKEKTHLFDEINLAARAEHAGGELVIRDIDSSSLLSGKDIMKLQGIKSVYCCILDSAGLDFGAAVLYCNGVRGLSGEVKQVVYFLLEALGVELDTRRFLKEMATAVC